MRIGIDARMFGPGFGLARYVQQLVHHLEQLDTPHEFVIFLQKEQFDTYTPASSKFSKILADVPWYGVAEQRRMPGIIAAANVDAMHFPHWNIPIMYRGPFVVTIHDLTMFHFPRRDASTHGVVVQTIKYHVHKWLLRYVVRRAKHIIATTQFTKQDIVDNLRVSGEKISVTYQAPFQVPTESLQKDAVLATYNITKPYVLYVGAAYPHKNLERLLFAWQALQKKYGTDYQLVLVGKNNYFYNRLREHDQLKDAAEQPVFTGFVPDDELTVLYMHADLFVFPSLYEGFGLPPLEAMQYDVPVVSSNASCLPEVLGEGALYVDPHNIDQLAAALYTGLTDEDVRAQLREQAQRELQRYSWKRLAQRTHDIYSHL